MKLLIQWANETETVGRLLSNCQNTDVNNLPSTHRLPLNLSRVYAQCVWQGGREIISLLEPSHQLQLLPKGSQRPQSVRPAIAKSACSHYSMVPLLLCHCHTTFQPTMSGKKDSQVCSAFGLKSLFKLKRNHTSILMIRGPSLTFCQWKICQQMRLTVHYTFSQELYRWLWRKHAPWVKTNNHTGPKLVWSDSLINTSSLQTAIYLVTRATI